ncbi:flavodoxin family protein [Luteipulveratus halotolerans]|uniref:Flavodoxin n=1 Tax=Luteipulveratus halotolerans TaxID=1631356 RepID=A0A0L6CLU1_9MICO|nr:NAD(P)H-dependent oxidoreductase [Luteipulveratus halotolerans]KNX38717.1 flavodoxin [Luteipulveratus halotolerans]
MSDVLRAVALVWTLSPSPTESSSEKLARQVLDAMPGVESTLVRVVDHDVRPGVQLDMGDGDEWPQIRRQVAEADILVVATPTWLGQHSSVCQRVLERLDAELSETDDHGRPSMFGTVAVGVVVGNEDGAHHITGVLYQALSDVGFTIPAQGVTYWNGEAMQGTDYRDLGGTPEKTAGTTAVAAANAVHLARLLKADPYPPSST